MQTLVGRHYGTGETVQVLVKGGIIQEVAPLSESELAERKLSLIQWIAPGLVDLQVNGHAGLDLNDHPLAADRVAELTRLLWKEGVTTYLPTIYTNEVRVIESALRAIAEACRTHDLIASTIAGIHVEGLFITLVDGPLGAHNKKNVIAPDWSIVEGWQIAAEGRIKLLTLSPEWPGSNEFIVKCVDSGVIVSIGHTAATSDQIAEAVIAGATMSTHLGNGTHLTLPRHPNYIWDQLAQDELWTCVIADGFHLPLAFIKVVRKAKQNKFVLVSDAAKYSGMEPGEYYNPAMGSSVVLTPEGRVHMLNEERLLAGSAQMLLHGVMHLVNNGVCTLKEAWDCASIEPANAIQLPNLTGLEPGAPADLVLFNLDGNSKIQIRQTYKGGILVYDRNEI